MRQLPLIKLILIVGSGIIYTLLIYFYYTKDDRKHQLILLPVLSAYTAYKQRAYISLINLYF